MKKKLLCLLLSCTMVLGMGFQAFGATAFCAGSNYSVNANIPGSIRDTIPAARYASRILNNLGYESTLSVNPIYATFYQASKNGKYEFGENDDGTKYTESTVLYFNGEGDGSHIAWWAPWSVGDNKNHDSRSGVSAGTKEPRIIQLDATGIDSDTKDRRFENDLSDVKLMILMGCNSYTMAKRLRSDNYSGNSRPQTIVGFNSTVNTDDVQKWSNYFMNELAGGATVQQALDYANSKKYGTTSVNNTSRIQGNSKLRIGLNNRNQGQAWEVFEDENGQIQKVPAKDLKEMDEIDKEIAYERSLYTDYQVTTTSGALTFDFDNPDYTPIVEYIKQNIDVNFDLNTYQIDYCDYEYEDDRKGSGFISFTLLINGLPTNVLYTAFIENSEVKHISRNGTPVYNVDMPQIPDTLAGISKEEIKAMAVKEDILKEGFHVTKQEIEKRFDTDTMRIYYFVLTTYEDPNGYEITKNFTYGLEE